MHRHKAITVTGQGLYIMVRTFVIGVVVHRRGLALYAHAARRSNATR